MPRVTELYHFAFENPPPALSHQRMLKRWPRPTTRPLWFPSEFARTFSNTMYNAFFIYTMSPRLGILIHESRLAFSGQPGEAKAGLKY